VTRVVETLFVTKTDNKYRDRQTENSNIQNRKRHNNYNYRIG